MDRTTYRCVAALLLAALVSPLAAQEKKLVERELTDTESVRGPRGEILLTTKVLNEDKFIEIMDKTTKVYKLPPPYVFAENPFVERKNIANVKVVPLEEGAAQQLPDAFEIESLQFGVTTLILPLLNLDTGQRESRTLILTVQSQFKVYFDEQRKIKMKQAEVEIVETMKRFFPSANVGIKITSPNTALAYGTVPSPDLVEPIIQFIKISIVQIFSIELESIPGEGGVSREQAIVGPDGRAVASSTNRSEENLNYSEVPVNIATVDQDIFVINAIRVMGEQQVQLKVVIAEVNRNKIRNLGFEWRWNDLGGGLQSSLFNFIGLGSSDFSEVLAQTPQHFSVTRANQFEFFGVLNALETHGLGRILSEPTIVATSGKPAFFNIGGRTPTVASGGQGQIEISYESFGTNIRFVPYVLGNGRIRLEVRPEISEQTGRVTIGGTTSLPEFSERTVETTVELENGQTFAIAGLIQERVTANTVSVPFLGTLPMVGWAFQNKQYDVRHIELLIMVTPHLVDPLNEAPCKLPGRESRSPNDLEFYIGSKFEPPCFADPYRNPWDRHTKGGPDPVPVPVVPYDNYGRPGGEFSLPSSESSQTKGPDTVPLQVPSEGPEYLPAPESKDQASAKTDAIRTLQRPIPQVTAAPQPTLSVESAAEVEAEMEAPEPRLLESSGPVKAKPVEQYVSPATYTSQIEVVAEEESKDDWISRESIPGLLFVVPPPLGMETEISEEATDVVAEEPVVEEPAVEEPVLEEPVVEEPVAEEPVVEEPVVEEPVAEEPVVEEPVVEKPVVEEPVVEEPIVLEPVVEEPVVEEPVAEEPVVEEPVAEESVAEEPVAEEPIVEEPVVEEPVAQDRVGVHDFNVPKQAKAWTPTLSLELEYEEPVAEEPIVEEPIVLEPVVLEPVVLEPVTQEKKSNQTGRVLPTSTPNEKPQANAPTANSKSITAEGKKDRWQIPWRKHVPTKTSPPHGQSKSWRESVPTVEPISPSSAQSIAPSSAK